MKKLIRPYVYEEDYNKIMKYAKSNFLRGDNPVKISGTYSFAKALNELLRPVKP